MLETHTMLRSDTTALFERLREANIMLQEVLSGAHENMGALENTLMLRVSEFVSAMNEITQSTGEATGRVESKHCQLPRHYRSGHHMTSVSWPASSMFMGASSPRLSTSIDHSNQHTEDRLNERRVQLDSLVATLDIRTEDLEKRLNRFSGLLDESLEAASIARAGSRASRLRRQAPKAHARDQRTIRARPRKCRRRARSRDRCDALAL